MKTLKCCFAQTKLNRYVYLLILLMLCSCKDASSQDANRAPLSKEEKANAPKLREAAKQAYFAAMKLCQNENYKEKFGDYRKPGHWLSSRDSNCCTDFIIAPYVSPAEFYFYRYEKDKEIAKIGDNPFKLKAYRKENAKREKKLWDEALKIDTENLVYYIPKGYQITEYDFNKERFILSPVSVDFIFHHKGGLKKSDRSKLYIEKSHKEAENLFDYFETLKNRSSARPLPYRANTKITYALRRSKEYQGFYFVVTIKKVELYKVEGWDDKIGEVNF